MDKIYVEYRFRSGFVLSGIVDRDEAKEIFRHNNNLSSPIGAIRAGSHVSVVLQDQELIEAKGTAPEDAPDFHRRKSP